jgi:hypothetical protein
MRQWRPTLKQGEHIQRGLLESRERGGGPYGEDLAGGDIAFDEAPLVHRERGRLQRLGVGSRP